MDEFHNQFVSRVECTPDNIAIVLPTWISSIEPTCGPMEGGTEIVLHGSGFWESDDITIRFSSSSDSRLPRAVLGTFDAATNQVSTRLLQM